MSPTRPVVFLFLMLPFGISTGFCTILVPYLLTKAGVPVAVAGSVVAIGLLPNVGRVLYAPLVDLSLSLARWYRIGLLACVGTVMLLAVLPIHPDIVGLVTAAVFLSQMGANLLAVPVGGFMALTVNDAEKGRAAGWYQAALLGGAGLGGGAGIWLATTFSPTVAGIVLGAAMLGSAAALRFVPDQPPIAAGQPLNLRFREMGRDLVSLLRLPRGRYVAVLAMCPIGVGAATNLWSAIAPYWHASSDVVAFSTGVLNGLAAGVGCVAGGWIADRIGRWFAFFGAGLTMALIALGIAEAPQTPMVFASGILLYALSQGWGDAASSAVALHAVGRGAAATKYAFIGSLSNIPVSYMTAVDGWAHDRFGAAGMLRLEALLGVVAVALGLVALWWTQAKISGATGRRQQGGEIGPPVRPSRTALD